MRFSLPLRLAAVFVPLVVGGCEKPAAPAAAPPPPVPVAELTVLPRPVPVSHPFTGQTDAAVRVEVRSRITGFLQDWTFEEGGRVEKDQVLFRIDPQSYEQRLRSARSRKVRAEASLDFAMKQVSRYTLLVEQDAASLKELEQYQTQADVARADIDVAQADVEAAELELSYCTVRSPVTGRIGRPSRERGAVVDPALNSLLATVIQTNPIDVVFSVNERDLLRWRADIQAGRLRVPDDGTVSVELTLLDGSVYPHVGRVGFVDIRVDPATGAAQVRASIDNPDDALRPGQFVRGSVKGYERVEVLAVPKHAVLLRPGGAIVWVVANDNKAEARPVEVGDWEGDDWIIDKGLRPGDRVIVSNLQRLAPGVAVAPQPNPAGAAPAAGGPPVTSNGGGR